MESGSTANGATDWLIRYHQKHHVQILRQNYLRNILFNSGLAGNIRLASELFRRGFLCSPWITKCRKQISSNVFDCRSRTRRLPGRQLPPLLTLTHTEHFSPPDHSHGVNNPQPREALNLAKVGTWCRRKGYCIPGTKHTLSSNILLLSTSADGLNSYSIETREISSRKLLHLPTTKFFSLTESIPISLFLIVTIKEETFAWPKANPSTWLQKPSCFTLPRTLLLFCSFLPSSFSPILVSHPHWHNML